MTEVAVVTPDSSFTREVARLVGTSSAQIVWDDAYLSADPLKIVHSLSRQDKVVVLGPGLPVEFLIEVAEAFDVERPDMCVVLVTEPTAALWERALRAGVRDVIDPTASATELRDTLTRALETAKRRTGALEAASEPHRVVAIVSPKGGVGKTMLASNLAVALGQRRPREVVAVDLDTQFGDLASALQLTPDKSLLDVANANGSLDATTVKVSLTPHGSGAYALCAPEDPAGGLEVQGETAAKAIQLLKEDFPWVIVDTAAGLDELTVAALRQATDIVYVCTMDVSSVRSLRKEVELVEQYGLSGLRSFFVLNRADARVGLDVRDVQRVVGMVPDALIPSSRSVPLAMNVGRPVIEREAASAPAREIDKLVHRLLGEPETDTPHINGSAPATPSLFGRKRR